MRAYRLGNRPLIPGFAVVLGIVAAGAGWNAQGGAPEAPPPAARGGPAAPSTTDQSSGQLDTSFAGDGTIMTFIPPILDPPGYNTDIAEAVAIDSDGRILVAGSRTERRFALERYNADGTLDTTFGTDGLATLPAPYDAEAACLVVQPDGRIVVGGGLNSLYALARFMPDGSLDPDFGQGGIVQPSRPLGPAAGIALLPDGRIVLGGGGAGYSLKLSRYEPNGLQDVAFGTNGVVDTGLSASGIIRMTQQADGRFVFVFWGDGVFVDKGVTLARFDSDGSSDAGFGSGGIVYVPLLGEDVVAQPDGKIVVGGASYRIFKGYVPELEVLDFEVARLNPDGSLDADFGRKGIVTTSFNGRPSVIQSLALDAQGRLVAAGATLPHSGTSDFALARYEPDGTIDKSFGKSGRTTADVDGLGLGESAHAIAVQPDGRLVVVGSVTIDREGPLDSFAWALARFLP